MKWKHIHSHFTDEKSDSENYYLVYMKSEAHSVGASYEIHISPWVHAELTIAFYFMDAKELQPLSVFNSC